MSDKKVGLFISSPPEDKDEKKKWVNQMLRIQVAMYVDSHATCMYCGHTYTSVDDFLERDPHKGHGKEFSFVCGNCYPKYAKLHPLPETKVTSGSLEKEKRLS